MNTFLSLLAANNVKYMISGHDHHHYNSIVTSPDNASQVHQLICQSDSSKFYTPANPVSPNDAPVEQDLYRVGYYVFTVDGPRVTIDYYADTHGNWQSDGNYPYGSIDLVNYPNKVTPTFAFAKRSTTGYSLNGKEILVSQGGSYVLTDDTSKAVVNGETGYFGTTAKVLNGTNGSTSATNYGKATKKAVDTGWAPKPAVYGAGSDVFTLWGMTDLGSDRSDTYVLSMTIDPAIDLSIDRQNHGFLTVIAGLTRNPDGSWADPAAPAVNKNVGGKKKYVRGPWNRAYALGTYGIDPATRTAWAVVNTTGDFAVVEISN
jgi:hypothetical protein